MKTDIMLGSFSSSDARRNGYNVWLVGEPSVEPPTPVVHRVEVVGGERPLVYQRGWNPRRVEFTVVVDSKKAVTDLLAACAHATAHSHLGAYSQQQDNMLMFADDTSASGGLPDLTKSQFYRVLTASMTQVEKIGRRYWKATVECETHPYVYHFAALYERVSLPPSQTVTVTNPFAVDALPEINLYGQPGNATITVNGEPYPVKLQGGGLVIDSELMTCTVGGQAAIDALIAKKFPTFTPGTNTIVMPAGVSGYMRPRWRSL